MKTLTIVVSSYNCSKTIQNTLNSIPCTGNDDFDVMIIDDGSTEDIYSLIKPYVKKYPNTMYYIRKENGGHGSCINYGIKHAKSRYIAFLDSDDTYNPVDFKVALKFLKETKKGTDIVRVNFNMVFVNKNYNKIVSYSVSHTTKRVQYKSFRKDPLTGFFTIHNCIYSVELLRKICKIPEHCSYEDNVLYYDSLLKANKIAYLNKAIHLYNYFIYGGTGQSISAAKSVQKFKDVIAIYNYMLAMPIAKYSKSRDKVIRKCFNLMLGWIMFILGVDESKDKKERGIYAKHIFKQYKDFCDQYPSRSLKPITYNFLAHLKYGGTNYMKQLSKTLKVSFIVAAVHQPKTKKFKKKKAKKSNKIKKAVTKRVRIVKTSN